MLLIFALSGFTGLIYESIWSHYLKLFLGHAAYAQSLVLCLFMGGMAIGAWSVARISERIARPLAAYAAVEFVIGLLALLFDRQFQWLVQWSFDTVLPSLATPGYVQLFKWSAGAALLLPQSILLGMTFPLISAGLVRCSPHRPGETLAMLYFANCIGAVAGVLLSGFYFIGHFGLPGTLLVAGGINLAVAFAAWLLGSRISGSSTAPASRDATLANAGATVSLLAVAAGITGLASFIYEIAWIRMLSLALGSSTHSFELMLSAFIFGLASGGLWIRRRIDSDKDPSRRLVAILLASSALAALTIVGYRYAFDAIAWAKNAFTPTATGYVGFNLVSQTVAVLIMVPVTFFSGMTLPLITHMAIRAGAGEGAIGRVYAFNTAGCILGVLVAVHVLLPSVGVKGAIIVGSLLTLGIALEVIRRSVDARDRKLAGGFALMTSVIVATVAVVVHPDPHRLASAVYRTGLVELPSDAEVLYLRDGKTATISLARLAGSTVIATNGKPDAAIRTGSGPPSDDEVTMILAGVLPLALHPHPRRVANIGIGSGLTSAVLLRSPQVEQVTSIEIEPFMVEAAAMGFRPRIDPMFRDPRSRIVIEDAKTFFASHPTKYDVIVSEPSNPWVSGVATLFSYEFYRQVRLYLNDDGLLVQWLQVYETDTDVVISVLKALSANFEDYQLYNVDDSNILVVASLHRGLPPLSDAPLRAPELEEELRRAGIADLEDLESRRIIDRSLFDAYVRRSSVPMNSDYFPFVDLNAARFRFMERNALSIISLGLLPVPAVELAIPAWATSDPGATSPFAQGKRTVLVHRAVRLVDAIVDARYSNLPPGVASLAASIDLPTSSCADGGLRGGWTHAVTEISRQTTPFLPAERLQPLWARLRSSPCYATLSPTDRAWTDFLAAVAVRDRIAIVDIGSGLLGRSLAWAGRDEAGMLVTSVAAAMYGLGRADAAAKLLTHPSRRIDLDKKYALMLQILAAASTSHTKVATSAAADTSVRQGSANPLHFR